MLMCIAKETKERSYRQQTHGFFIDITKMRGVEEKGPPGFRETHTMITTRNVKANHEQHAHQPAAPILQLSISISIFPHLLHFFFLLPHLFNQKKKRKINDHVQPKRVFFL